MFHPTRGGTRGGRDQFNWEDVKDDKHRENYLGHSLMAPIGRWQKGKDLNWYSKESKDDTKTKANMLELQRIKEAEAEAMAIALGVKKKKTLESNVTEEELKRALIKGGKDSDDEKDNVDAEKGLGYGKSSRLPIQDQQQIGRMEIMNAGNNAVASYSNYNNEDEERREKKKSKKHHKSSKKRHRHHDSDSEDGKRHSSSSKRRHRDDSSHRSSRKEHRHHDDKRRHRERSNSRDDERRDRHSSSRHSRLERGDYSRKSSHRDTERKRSRSRSLSPYSKRVQMSKK